MCFLFLVARIAYDKLASDYPSVLSAVNAELKPLSDAYADLTKKESNYPFVECATLADDIRMAGGQWQE